MEGIGDLFDGSSPPGGAAGATSSASFIHRGSSFPNGVVTENIGGGEYVSTPGPVCQVVSIHSTSGERPEGSPPGLTGAENSQKRGV